MDTGKNTKNYTSKTLTRVALRVIDDPERVWFINRTCPSNAVKCTNNFKKPLKGANWLRLRLHVRFVNIQVISPHAQNSSLSIEHMCHSRTSKYSRYEMMCSVCEAEPTQSFDMYWSKYVLKPYTIIIWLRQNTIFKRIIKTMIIIV